MAHLSVGRSSRIPVAQLCRNTFTSVRWPSAGLVTDYLFVGATSISETVSSSGPLGPKHRIINWDIVSRASCASGRSDDNDAADVLAVPTPTFARLSLLITLLTKQSVPVALVGGTGARRQL